MALRVLAFTAILAAAAVAGCASMGGPVLDADGCRPAMAIYQPGVVPGGPGHILHIPRSCPAPPPTKAPLT